MGATAFYGWPYPDPGSDVDVPRDIKALADKLELMKNGFTVPTGNVTIGADAAAQRWLDILIKDGAVSRVARLLSPGAGVIWQLRGLADGALSGYLSMNDVGALAVYSGGQSRPIPYATLSGQTTLPTSATVATSQTFTFVPSTRFTATPYIVATPYTSSGNHDDIYAVRAWGGSGTGYTLGCQQVAGTTWTVAMPVSWWAFQMTPTTTPGLRQLADEGDHPSRTVTCHTAGCDGENEAVSLLVPENSMGVSCGGCGEPIEDMTARKKVRK